MKNIPISLLAGVFLSGCAALAPQREAVLDVPQLLQMTMPQIEDEFGPLSVGSTFDTVIITSLQHGPLRLQIDFEPNTKRVICVYVNPTYGTTLSAPQLCAYANITTTDKRYTADEVRVCHAPDILSIWVRPKQDNMDSNKASQVTSQ